MLSLNGRGPIFSYFAFSTDLKESNEFERYFRYDPQIRLNSMIDTICVMKHGYWYKRNSYNGTKHLNTSWLGIKSDNDFNEVLGFISGILNTLNQVSQLGYYLLDEGQFPFYYMNFLQIGFEIEPEKINTYNEYAIAFEKNEYQKEIEKLKELVPEKQKLVRILSVFSRDTQNDANRIMLYEATMNQLLSE